MFLKSVFAKVSESTNQKKYEQELIDSIGNITKLNVIIGNEGVTRYCVFVKPDTDIHSVQETFAKCGIDLKKHFIKEHKEQKDILYINVVDFAKLSQHKQNFFNQIAAKIVK